MKQSVTASTISCGSIAGMGVYSLANLAKHGCKSKLAWIAFGAGTLLSSIFAIGGVSRLIRGKDYESNK